MQQHSNASRALGGAAVWRLVAALAIPIAAVACSPTAPSATDLRGLQITSVSPQVGSTVVVTRLSIVGTGFVAGARLSVDGQDVPTTVNTSMLISATRPPRVPEMTLTNPDGRSVRLVGAAHVDVDHGRIRALYPAGRSPLTSGLPSFDRLGGWAP